MMKRGMAWLLTLMMVICLIPVTLVQAEDASGDTKDDKYAEFTDSAEIRAKLQEAVDFVEKMDESMYETASWKEFMTVVEEAKHWLRMKPMSTKQEVEAAVGVPKSQYEDTFARLQKTKAEMRFVSKVEAAKAQTFRFLTGDELVYEMGLGTNLGNTLDGHSGFTPSETAWQSAVTTKEYITALHDAGYNTVRIPVTWGNMIEGDIESGFSINENWLHRVQEIVDYCVSQDMYAIINIHHDGAEQTGWLRVASEHIDEVYYQFECVWRLIAEHFRDYDEHLIFESMNEITCMEGDRKNSAEAIAYDTPIIMNLNQIFVNVVRSTGSNNRYRWLACVAHYANNGSNKEFALPEDTYNDGRGLMFAAHIYKHSTNVSWTYDQIYEVVDGLKRMANKFDVPMFLGEYGNRIYEQEGTATGYNDVERAYFCEIVSKACQVAGVVPCVWDQGYGTKGAYETGLYSYWNRSMCTPIFENIVEAMVRGTYLPATDANKEWDFGDIVKNPTVKKITDIRLSETAVTMTIGEQLTISPEAVPTDTNDVLLWSTDDASIVTVSRGILRARGIGTTTVRVYSQSGSVEKEITVTVMADTESVKVEITTDKEEYQVVVGQNMIIDCSLYGGEGTFKSANPKVATVNAEGKIFGVAKGVTYVVITADSGLTKTVRVEVVDAKDADVVKLALHVLYNDAEHSYWGCETGTAVAVNGDGTYTVSFDLAKNLSVRGKNAGIMNMQNLTAIYIKDIDVTKGKATKSPLVSASIVYDSVVVNGTKLTMLDHEAAEGVKSGVFDSGKPINAWDGSVVQEVAVSDHTATFTSIAEPTTIEVTFTLSNVVFEEKEIDSDDKAPTLSAKFQTEMGLNTSQEMLICVNPVGTDAVVTVVSADMSVVTVNCAALKPDEEGVIRVPLYGVRLGETTIMVKDESGAEIANLPIRVVEKVEEPNNDDSDTTTLGDTPENKIPWGIIAGVAAGVLAVVVMISVIWCYVLRRKKDIRGENTEEEEQ